MHKPPAMDISPPLIASLPLIPSPQLIRSITLQAVNLGDDTDTVAALAGALAGITHGPDKEWMEAIVGAERIHALLNG